MVRSLRVPLRKTLRVSDTKSYCQESCIHYVDDATRQIVPLLTSSRHRAIMIEREGVRVTTSNTQSLAKTTLPEMMELRPHDIDEETVA
jgi:hypothetical protein